jgi:hypothetical protein
VDFWRKPPPLIGFGVERHTLAHRRYHPGISPYVSGVSIVECAAQPRRAQASLRIRRSAIDLCPDCSFVPTHWRSSQGASIEPSIIRFRRWNLADRFIQPFRAQLFRTDIWRCMQSSRADPDKPFRPISSSDETIVLSHIAADSVGGIFWGAFSVPGGAQTPQGSRSSAVEVRSEFRQTSIPV